MARIHSFTTAPSPPDSDNLGQYACWSSFRDTCRFFPKQSSHWIEVFLVQIPCPFKTPNCTVLTGDYTSPRRQQALLVTMQVEAFQSVIPEDKPDLAACSTTVKKENICSNEVIFCHSSDINPTAPTQNNIPQIGATRTSCLMINMLLIPFTNPIAPSISNTA